MIPVNVLRYGRPESLPEVLPLRAGPLSLFYEAGDLRHIRLGDREILRRVYGAVRDRNWGTVPAVLSDVDVQVRPDSFRIAYTSTHRQGAVDFVWQATLTGDAQGTVTFMFDGEARSTFLRNRIGLCVLHPMREFAGGACRVEHTDGSVESGPFPEHIAPHHPFRDIRAIGHPVSEALRAEVRFEGDTFEMEDQRNWTDASFKTYGTPLSLPFPVEVPAGTRIRQSLTLTLRGPMPPALAAEDAAPVTLTVGDASGGPLPQIGLGLASHGHPLTVRERERLRALHLRHLRVDLRLSDPDFPAVLERAAAEARALGVGLEAAVFLTDDMVAELADLADTVWRLRPPVACWMIFHTDGKTTPEYAVRLAREHLAALGPQATFGGGTDAYFAALNRAELPVTALDMICYSVNPQVHARDNISVMETPEAQAATVRDAHRIAHGRPVAVSPVTLRPRFNPDATGAPEDARPGELPPEVDARQMSLFGAAWTAASLKNLAEAGAARVTYYETTGWRGVMETEAGAPLPDAFRSVPGAVFSMYHVFADLGEFAGGALLPVDSDQPQTVVGLGLRHGGRRAALVANLTNAGQDVRVRGVAPTTRVRLLDETNAEAAMRDPEGFRGEPPRAVAADAGHIALRLRPYGIARITWEAGDA